MSTNTNSNVRLTLLQQPEIARSFGNGTSNFRSIDPPPILNLKIHQVEPTSILNGHYIVTATLWSVDERDEPVKELCTELAGNTIAESRVLENLNGLMDIIFIFPSLYVKNQGRYRICFRLISVFTPTLDGLLPCTSVIDTLFSNVIQVFLRNRFPGKSKPSLLMQVLVKQTDDLKARNL
ncbi:velvet factor [Globomyces pollinis-pini]|nr:velvet factor [Globomyces pollinis-pini]